MTSNPRMKPKADPIDPKEWESRRQDITRLYLATTRKDMMEAMESQGFFASLSQYTYQLSKWNVKKYRSRDQRAAGELHHADRPPGDMAPLDDLLLPMDEDTPFSFPLLDGAGDMPLDTQYVLKEVFAPVVEDHKGIILCCWSSMETAKDVIMVELKNTLEGLAKNTQHDEGCLNAA